MKLGGFAARVGLSVIGTLAVVGVQQPRALAQHVMTMQKDDSSRTSALVQAVREATKRFQDPQQALNENYIPTFGCVTGSSEGAMGVHFVNFGLVGDPALDVSKPEVLIYEPLPNNHFRLTGADYLVFSSAWDALNPGPPQLMGQLFHLFEAPNRFGLPQFYTLHVWAWKDNPQGTFANWNPNVSCDAYNPQ